MTVGDDVTLYTKRIWHENIIKIFKDFITELFLVNTGLKSQTPCLILIVTYYHCG